MSAVSVTAAAALGAVLLLAPPAGAVGPLQRLGFASTGPGHGIVDGRREARVLGAAAVVAAAWALVGAGVVLLLAGAGALVSVARRLGRYRRARVASQARQRAVISLCDDLGAEIRAGIPAPTAVERVCAGVPDLASVVAATRLGGDVAAALRLAACRPGAEGLRAVAAAWEVAAGAGSGLATVLDRVAASLRSDEEARAEVRAALAPPRATARMLAVLPLVGLALGSSIGADPIRFLVTTQVGLGCLGLGVSLAAAGVWWVERLARSAER